MHCVYSALIYNISLNMFAFMLYLIDVEHEHERIDAGVVDKNLN